MLVTNVAMKNQPKMRPVLRVSIRIPLVATARRPRSDTVSYPPARTGKLEGAKVER
jgi:hypothetical protein